MHSCIGGDRQPSPGRIAEVIATYRPDVVALQELDVGRSRTGAIDQAQAIAMHLGMKHFFNPAIAVAEEQYGDAILTTMEMRLIKAAALPSVGEKRGALWVEIEDRGKCYNVINTHLGLSRRDRSAQVAALLGPAWLGNVNCKSPRILLGDFNAIPSSLVYKQITRELADVWIGQALRPKKTFLSRLPLLRIDHIFADRALKVSNVNVGDTPLAKTASDHLPLFAELSVEDREVDLSNA